MALKPLNSPGGFSVGEITTGAINVISSTGNLTTGNLISNSGSTGNINIIAGNIVTAGTVFAPAIVANSSTYDTRVSLNSAAGIVEITSNGNSTKFSPAGQIELGGVSQIVGGTFAGSGLTLGPNQTDLFQNRGGNVTVQVGTGGTIANTWTFAQSGELLAPGNIISSGNVSGTYLLGNGAFITGLPAGYSNADVANYLPTYTGNLVSLTGNVITTANISGSYILGNGRFLDGMYGNAEVKSYLESGATINANFGTGTVTTSGNISGGNLVSSANIDGTNVNATKLASSGALTINSGSNGNINIQPNGSGNVVLSNTFINSVAYPVQDQDAASKIYVDNLVTTAISYHTSVVAATNTDLATATGGTITYNQPNGVGNGVGATLTTTGSFNLIDTANVQSANARILVKNESNGAFNGIYVWSNATAITRADDEDTYGAGSPTALGLNDYFFVTGGNINLGSAWIVDAPNGAITFGSSNIQFAQFSQTQIYSANTSAGLTLVGQQFNAKTDNNTTAFDGGGNIIVKAGANLTTPNIGNATGSSLNVTGTVTGSLLTGELTTAAQPNITSVGTLTSLDVTGNISSLSGNVSGNYILGNGYFLTNINAANIVGSYGNSDVANYLASGSLTSNIVTTGNITGGNLSGTLVTGTLTTAAQPNITSLGTLNSLTVATTVLADGYSARTGADLTIGVLGANANIIIAPNGTGVTNFSNKAISNISSAAINGNVTATGNVQGSYLLGNGAFITGLPAGYSNADVANYLASNANVTITTTGNITTSGNISANNYLGAGDNVTIAAGSYNWTFDNLGNVTGTGNVVTTGNVVGGYFIGNGSQLTGLPASYSNANVASYLASNANVAILTTGNITTSANAVASFFIGDGSLLSNINAGNIAGSYGNAQVAAYLQVYNGNASFNHVNANSISCVANITAGNVAATLLTGTLTTAAQPNITTVGTLVSLDVSANITAGGIQMSTGNATIGNLYVTGNTTIAGNIQQISGNSGQFFGNAATGFNALYAGLPAGFTLLPQSVMNFVTSYNGYSQVNNQNQNGGDEATVDYVLTGNNGDDETYYFDIGYTSSGFDGTIAGANNAIGTAAETNDAYMYTTANVAAGQIGNLILATIDTNSQIRFVVGGRDMGNTALRINSPNTVSANSVSGTAVLQGDAGISGNINTGGFISATGNITSSGNVSGTYLLGNGAFITGLPAGYSNADVANYLNSAPNINITLGNSNSNITTGGTVRTYGNAIANNFTANNALTLNGLEFNAVTVQAYTQQTTTTSLSNIASITVASLPADTSAVEVTLRGRDLTNTQAGKIMIVWGGSNMDFTRYAEVIAGNGCGTPTVVFDGTTLTLQVTPVTANLITWNAKVVTV